MPAIATKASKATRHEQIITNIREKIAVGAWKPGERLPSFAQLREEYGVVPSTIDRVYAVLEQEGLVVREQGKGIFVAQPPESRPKGIVGLKVTQDREMQRFPYWMHLLEGIQSVAHEASFEILMLGPSIPVWEKMDGILVHEDNADDWLIHRPPFMPAVAMMSPSKLVPTVGADDFGGTKEVVEYLISQGHRQIGCMMINGTPLPERRLAGYYTALSSAGIQPQAGWMHPLQFGIKSRSLRELGRWNMQQWIQNGWAQSGCTAILVQNDRIAQGVLDALHGAGIRVPEEVSVVGFDGTEESEESHPTLTSVHVPLFEIGAAATKLLLNQINGSEAQAHALVLPAHFQARETTGPAPQ